MILLDTTVLVYAVGDRHELRASATWLLREIGAGRLTATSTVEVMQEFTHVRARRRPRADAAGVARDLITLLTPLTPVTVADLETGLQLFEQHPELGSFDAVLAATARRLGAHLISADEAFRAPLGPGFVPLRAAREQLSPGSDRL